MKLVSADSYLQSRQHVSMGVIQLFLETPRRAYPLEHSLHASQIIRDGFTFPLHTTEDLVAQRELKIGIAETGTPCRHELPPSPPLGTSSAEPMQRGPR
jgi:hypothetical protein